MKVLFLSVALLLSANAFCQELPKSIQLYTNAWRELSAADRLKIIKSFWTEESVYDDPAGHAKGTTALNTMIEKFWKDFPGATFETSPVLSQGNYYTWHWSIYDRTKTLVVKGVDVAEVNASGQMIRLIGFWDTAR